MKKQQGKKLKLGKTTLLVLQNAGEKQPDGLLAKTRAILSCPFHCTPMIADVNQRD